MPPVFGLFCVYCWHVIGLADFVVVLLTYVSNFKELKNVRKLQFEIKNLLGILNKFSNVIQVTSNWANSKHTPFFCCLFPLDQGSYHVAIKWVRWISSNFLDAQFRREKQTQVKERTSEALSPILKPRNSKIIKTRQLQTF